MELNDETFFLYAAMVYKNPSCVGVKDFKDDLNRFKYIKRLMNKYKKTGELSERLLLNHIILLHNVFGKDAVKLMFFKIEKKFWPQLKTFLVFLEYLPANYTLDGVDIVDIPLDPTIVDALRKI